VGLAAAIVEHQQHRRPAAGPGQLGGPPVPQDPGEGGREVARGLVNYSAAESRRILGRPSSEIESVLGYVDEPELIHRDNLVLL